LAAVFSRIVFYDADPSAAAAWRAFARRFPNVTVASKIGDITEALDSWSRRLEEFIAARPASSCQVATFLNALKAPPPVAATPDAQIIISLNMISQITPFWRDRCRLALRGFAPAACHTAETLSAEIDAAIEHSCRILLESHFKMLNQSAAEQIIIILDLEHYYYRDDSAAWESQAALPIEFSPFLLPAYHIEAYDTWLWHVIPQNINPDGYGVFHRVGAFDFRRS